MAHHRRVQGAGKGGRISPASRDRLSTPLITVTELMPWPRTPSINKSSLSLFSNNYSRGSGERKIKNEEEEKQNKAKQNPKRLRLRATCGDALPRSRCRCGSPLLFLFPPKCDEPRGAASPDGRPDGGWGAAAVRFGTELSAAAGAQRFAPPLRV